MRGPDGFLVKCKANEPGILLGRITTRARFDGYHDQEATQKKIVRDAFKKGDAWFNTGDLLRMDEKRRLFFVDRMGDTFRWKGENVSTFEVQEQISSWPPATEANAYGVQIPGSEGRAGMVALVLRGEFDGRSFREHVDSSLPPYARPLFVRVRESLEVTGTFKLKKGNLSAEGFDPNALQDPIFFRDPAQDSYVPLTAELYEQLQKGSSGLKRWKSKSLRSRAEGDAMIVIQDFRDGLAGVRVNHPMVALRIERVRRVERRTGAARAVPGL